MQLQCKVQGATNADGWWIEKATNASAASERPKRMARTTRRLTWYSSAKRGDMAGRRIAAIRVGRSACTIHEEIAQDQANVR